MSRPYFTNDAPTLPLKEDYLNSQLLSVLGDEGSRENSTRPDESASVSKPVKVSLDPINWFGILVPPDLRSAQASFKLAVMPGFVELANIALEMRDSEAEIRRLRDTIRHCP